MLGGRFVIQGVLGAGGMGRVVLAMHRELGELRAIKLLHPDRALNDTARRRLVNEARAAARIQSAHVVRVFDVVVDDGSGCPYVVMEHLTGETLEARLVHGPLAVRAAVRIVIEACEALAEAHRAGTVHRDLKPSNLFLTAPADGTDFVKVLDFGIAKTEEARFGGNWTQSQALLATPAYASPEQLRASRDVDSRSDVWSLGVILYECLSGHLPFEAATLAEISSRVLRDEPIPLHLHRPDIPVDLERLIARCLEKRREARPPDADALIDALAAFAPEAANACREHLRGLPAPPRHSPHPHVVSTLTVGRADGRRADGQDETLSQSLVATVALANAPVARGGGRRFRAVARPSLLAGVAALGVLASWAVFGGGRPAREAATPPTAPVTATRTTEPAPTLVADRPAAPASAMRAPRIREPLRPMRARRSSPATRAPESRPRPPTPPPEETHARAVTLEQLQLDTLIDERK